MERRQSAGEEEVVVVSRRKGKREENQPTVRERSTSGKRSSRPWLSRVRRWREWPVQRERARAREARRTSRREER
jgi:hypothetical protein